MFSGLAEFFHIYRFDDLLRALVDLALVYLLVYQVLLLIRGTRAVQMLVGLLLVIAAYTLSSSNAFELATLNWVLDKFIESFILVIVVLFQQDIRRGLTTFARQGLFRGLSRSQDASFVEELVRACSLLSERRIGALIAVEREADLAEYVQEAIPLEALMSKETLFAVFNPANANPLHDGAVIIRDDRIHAAGCFLPLTSNPRVDKELGTRHRAGIGLSEDTDAVVLIVSEETGAVSVAVAGQLERALEQNALRESLQRLLGVRTVKEQRREARRAPDDTETESA